MKLLLIQTTFALPIWYRLSNPGEGWENGTQFNSQLENTQKTPSADYRTATMGGFVPVNGNNLPTVGEPVEFSEVQAPSGGDQEAQDSSDARIVSFSRLESPGRKLTVFFAVYFQSKRPYHFEITCLNMTGYFANRIIFLQSKIFEILFQGNFRIIASSLGNECPTSESICER